MSFLDKILRRKPARDGLAHNPSLVTNLAKETSDKLADEKFSFAKAYREFRQYRSDARIRRELQKSRAYAIASRPRTPQAKATAVSKSKGYVELSNGQILRRGAVHTNPVLIGLLKAA